MPKPSREPTAYPILKPNNSVMQAHLKNVQQSVKRSNTAAACAACKLRKTRCSGKQPCEKCMTLNTPCLIDEKSDARRKGYHDRALGDLKTQKCILDGLLLVLRTSSGSSLWQMLNLINCQASPNVLARSILQALPPPFVDAGGGLDACHDIRRGLEELISNHDDDEMTEASVTSNTQRGDTSPSNMSSTSSIEKGSGERGIWEHQSSYKTASEDAHDGSSWTAGSPSERNFQAVLSSVVSQSPVSSFGSSFDWGGPRAQSAAGTKPIDLTTLLKTMEIVNGMQGSNELRSPLSRTTSRSLGTVLPRSLPEPAWQIPKMIHQKSSTVSDAAMTPLLSAGRNDCSPTSVVQDHLALPVNIGDQSRMAGAINSYLDLARRMLSQGATTTEIFGPSRPNMDLFWRSRQIDDDHSTCNFAAEICSCSAMAQVEPSVRYAMAFMFTYLLRWMILTSEENFSKIPALFKPTATQRTLPHSIAVELCPLPQLRDLLCRGHGDLSLVLQYVSCNWASVDGNVAMNDAFERVNLELPNAVPGAGRTRQVFLTDTFCIHVMRLENWSIDPRLFVDHPEFQAIVSTPHGGFALPTAHAAFVG